MGNFVRNGKFKHESLFGGADLHQQVNPFSLKCQTWALPTPTSPVRISEPWMVVPRQLPTHPTPVEDMRSHELVKERPSIAPSRHMRHVRPYEARFFLLVYVSSLYTYGLNDTLTTPLGGHSEPVYIVLKVVLNWDGSCIVDRAWVLLTKLFNMMLSSKTLS